MTKSAPLSRIVRVEGIPKEGETVVIEANASERAALASLNDLPDIAAFTAKLRVERWGRGGARVTGAVHGEVTQVCIVSLDPFPALVDEEIDVRFAPPEAADSARRLAQEVETLSIDDEDEPDPVIDGRIDVGALAAEFLALGLDPYPRKPGVAFEPSPVESEEEKPLAALRRLRPPASG